jgi:hypothetical protein
MRDRGKLLNIPTAVAFFALGLSIYLLTMPADLRNNGDTVDRFMVTQALLHGRTYVQGPGLPHPTDTRLSPGRHGNYYTIYAPGQSVLMAPLYVAGRVASDVANVPKDFATAIAARTLDPILGGLVLAFFYLLALEAGFRRRTAILITLIVAFASTLWPDVQSGQEQTQVTLAIVMATCFVMRAKLSGERRNKRRWLLLAGAAIGFGIFTRYDFVIPGAILFVWASWQLWPGRNTDSGDGSTESATQKSLWSKLVDVVWPLVLGVAPFILLDAAWNSERYGVPWRIGESASAQLGFPIWQGVPNLMVSPGKGLLWYLPLVWLLPFAVRPFWSRCREISLLSTLFICMTLFYANFIYWHGDPAWGPRYLYPLVPLLVLPLGELIERFGSLRLTLRGFTIAVIGLSLAVQLAAVTVDPWRFWYDLVQQRQQAGQIFQWNPRTYGYYWSTNPSFIPPLYQIAAVKDVVQIGLGDTANQIPLVWKAPTHPSGSSVTAYDRWQAAGVAERPLDTIGSIWLNDRYQWFNPVAVPLSLLSRLVIIGLLLIVAAASALVLHFQYWYGEEAQLGAG